MGRKLISLGIVLIAALTLAVGSEEAEAFGPHWNHGSQHNQYSAAPQPAPYIVPYTAYVAPPVGCLPPLGGFNCHYQNSGYRSQSYKGCITKLP